MNDRVNVDYDMPQIKRGWKRVTVTVIAKLKSGEEVKAFAADDDWYYDSNCHKIHTPVIAWKSEPTPMTAPDNPCYLCQRRTPHCHSQCKDYIAYTQARQALSKAKLDGGLDAYERDRYNKIQMRLRHGHK